MRFYILTATILALYASALQASDQSETRSTQISPMQAFPGTDNIPSGNDTSVLTRTGSSLKLRVRTSGLDPMSPYTVWAVVFNKPRYCQSAPCGFADLQVSPGHDPRVEASIAYVGGGATDADGRGDFLGRLFRTREGVVTTERLAGPGLLFPWRAEIHVVVRGHGYPATEDEFAAISSFAGGCNEHNSQQPPCEDQQFAIHLARP